MQAAVLAGGLGMRLRPLTGRMPKVMAPVCGKPFIGHLLELLKRGGVEEVVICAGYFSGQIMDFVASGNKWGIGVAYSIEERPLGTAGALKYAEPLLNDNFLVINGDTYLLINHKYVMASFLISGKEGMMTACPHPEYRNDVLVLDGIVLKNNKVNPEPDFNFVNAGVLALAREALRFIPTGKRCELEDCLYQQLIAKKSLAACITAERFYDIGTFEGIRQLEEYFDNHPNTFPY